MISLHNVGSAGQALHYFSQDNYYTQDKGLEHSEWFGKGAEQLGLSGQIDQRSFLDLLQGKVEGQELGRWAKNPETGEKERCHRPATDVTFSAPKSVSLMAEVYGRREVREAHETAVKKALIYIETHLAGTRQTEHGKTQVVDNGKTDPFFEALARRRNVLIRQWTHAASRKTQNGENHGAWHTRR